MFGEARARRAVESVAIDTPTQRTPRAPHTMTMLTAFVAQAVQAAYAARPPTLLRPNAAGGTPKGQGEVQAEVADVAAAPGWPALVAERAALVRFARRRLPDASQAEDLVHDVFEAVVSGRARFDGRASLRTWLTAILKHKIVDQARAQRGHCSLDPAWDDDDAIAAPELECPQPRPDEVAAQREQLSRTLTRIRALPATLRLAFERRVLADEDSADVCRALGISENNLFVRLHRARALLAA